MEDFHYLISRYRALKLALHNEVRGMDFYAQVAGRTRNPEVRQLAMEMAREEGAHVELLRDWLAREDVDLVHPLTDLDPPNMPE